MADLSYSTEVPTKPGQYWLRRIDEDACIVKLAPHGGSGLAWWNELPRAWVLVIGMRPGGLWAGPLAEPPIPKPPKPAPIPREVIAALAADDWTRVMWATPQGAVDVPAFFRHALDMHDALLFYASASYRRCDEWACNRAIAADSGKRARDALGLE